MHIVYKYTKQHWASGRLICYLLSACLFVAANSIWFLNTQTHQCTRVYFQALWETLCAKTWTTISLTLHVFTCACLCVCWPFANTRFNTAAGLFTFYNWHGCCCAFFLSSLYRGKLHIHTVSWKTLLEFLLQCLQSRLHVEERHKVARKVLSAKNIENTTQIESTSCTNRKRQWESTFKKCIEISFMCWMRFVLYVPKPSFKKILCKIMHWWLVWLCRPLHCYSAFNLINHERKDVFWILASCGT